MRIPKPFRLRMTLGMTNLITFVLFLAGTVILVNGSFVTEHTITPSAEPAIDIAILLSIPAILAVVLAVGSSADRKCADDYAYQLLATGALVGMFAMMGASAVWAIDSVQDAIGIRDLRGQDMMAIGFIGWFFGYLTFRIRGL